MPESASRLSKFLELVYVDNFEEIYSSDITESSYFTKPIEPIITSETYLRSNEKKGIAYLSMEYGLASSFYNIFKTSRPVDIKNHNKEQEVFSNYRLADYLFTINTDSIIDLPIYSGGLGVLAGDSIKTFADYKLPAVGVGILWNTGYFKQRFWFKYGQLPEKMHWDFYTYPGLIPLKNRIKVSLKNQSILLRLWKYYIYSYKNDYAIPLILLDANLKENNESVRSLTDQLYRSDNAWIKAMQRIILGMGGVLALKELGYNIDVYHLNEGHAAFAFVEKARGLKIEEKEGLKKNFVYTCHTPVEAGHDRFSTDDLSKILNKDDLDTVMEFGRDAKQPGTINLTLFSLNIASCVNAVSKKHQDVMHLQFPNYKERIKYVTNGVHPYTWISDNIMAVLADFPEHFGDIKENPMALSRATDLKGNRKFREALWQAHQNNKGEFCGLLNKWRLQKDILTICWARRIAAYKRPSLILKDVKKLVSISKKIGPIQIIFAGKAHPNDDLGFTFINEMLDTVDKLSDYYDYLKIIILENYDISMAKKLISSVDIWLNNPLPPFEASGTSGMKAILNGVIQLSTIDGWVAEAVDKNVGRFFGFKGKEGEIGSERDLHLEEDSKELYAALEEVVDLYYKTNKKGKVELSSNWIDIMINCLAMGARFNTYRMVDEYRDSIWNARFVTR